MAAPVLATKYVTDLEDLTFGERLAALDFMLSPNYGRSDSSGHRMEILECLAFCDNLWMNSGQGAWAAVVTGTDALDLMADPLLLLKIEFFNEEPIGLSYQTRAVFDGRVMECSLRSWSVRYRDGGGGELRDLIFDVCSHEYYDLPRYNYLIQLARENYYERFITGPSLKKFVDMFNEI